MGIEHLNLKIVLILTIGFALASFLGYLSLRLKLSSIFGYLLAGYIIGPYSPGFEADREVSEQLAEIGVVLMMFGVGLHFNWKDLFKVKSIAITGAIGQTLTTTVISTALMVAVGWSLEAAILFGIAIGVASTMVLVRVLSDNHLLHTIQGKISVGWLVVEDIITVAALLLLPILADSYNGFKISPLTVTTSLLTIVAKFLLLVVVMFTVVRKFVKFALTKIVKLKSHELFTLSILALTFVLATGSALLFGTSIALGAFIAGMVIGQTDVRHQVTLNTTPLKDAFVVIFFLSIGMLFNPIAVFDNFWLFIVTITIILFIKPAIAFLISALFKYPFKVALTVALALAQIGEFSFILAEEALRLDILPDQGYDIIVASALISISINPLLFRLVMPKKPRMV